VSRAPSVPGMSLDLALIVFHRIEGAERAYADVLETSGRGPWVHELAFVEHHRHDRIVVRGTFAGRYVDLDERGDVIGKRTAEGALTGAAAGLLFGPMGLAVGMVGGASLGGRSEAGHAPHLHDALIDELRAELPEKSSALLLLAAPDHVDAMVATFDGSGGRVVRHSLSPEGALALEEAVAGRPAVA
jgi:uncharacterized membrane protein